MTKVYIAGPMTGLPENNYPAFNLAEKKLVARGFNVKNPAQVDRIWNVEPGENDYHWYLKKGLSMLLGCHWVATLPGYLDSNGALLECTVAEAVGIAVRPLEYFLESPHLQRY